ncbi:hypothetical protein K1719_027579 [Acacia pycnantha]|nr:hypothetical protein K1719_027579 [Acacia pycnantha]
MKIIVVKILRALRLKSRGRREKDEVDYISGSYTYDIRRIPIRWHVVLFVEAFEDVLLPPKWTCSKNVWDPTRSSCSALEELGPKELEDLLKSSKDVLLPPKWTCSKNVWDPTRSSCSALEELGPKELEDLLKSSKGLDALANVAVLGDSLEDPCESLAG